MILAGLALGGTAWANGPRAGGVEAYVNSIEGDTFSPNTRVKSEVLFNLSNQTSEFVIVLIKRSVSGRHAELEWMSDLVMERRLLLA